MVSEVVLLYVTCPTHEMACAISEGLVRQRVAACVNILPAITSLYEWQGRLEQASEVVMIVKTTTSKAEAATAAIVAVHPSACPCVVQLAATGGHAPFLQWIGEQTDGVAGLDQG